MNGLLLGLHPPAMGMCLVVAYGLVLFVYLYSSFYMCIYFYFYFLVVFSMAFQFGIFVLTNSFFGLALY